MRISDQIRHVDMMWVVNNKQYPSLNHPSVMVGSDSKSYQVKFNKPDDMRIGINELVCTIIASELGLPVFQPVIANVSQELIDGNESLRQYCAGEYFAQIYLEPFETVESYHVQGKHVNPDLIGNIGFVPDFIVFDKYIENYDRHGGNICLRPNSTLPKKVDYYLFDHDLAFQRDPAVKRDVSGLRELKTRLIFMHFNVDCIDRLRLFSRGISKTVALTNKIPDIINQIPKSWTNGYESYVNNIEVVLTTFTEALVNDHIHLNMDKLPSLRV